MHSLSTSLRIKARMSLVRVVILVTIHFKMVAFTISYYSDQALENHVELMEKQQNPKQNNKETKQKTPTKQKSKATQKIQATHQMISFT